MYMVKIFRRQYENWNKFQEWNAQPRGIGLFESMISEEGPFRIFTFESEEWATWFLLKL